MRSCRAIIYFTVSTGVAIAVSGCAVTPMGPTVQAMPGPGKTFDAFQADNGTCKVFAADQVKGQADAANQRAAGVAVLGTVLGAGLGAGIGAAAGDAGAGAAIGGGAGVASGAAIGANMNANDQAMIQQQYDNAFSQCMYAKGEQVPGYAPMASAALPPPMASADPTVRSIQTELIRLRYLHDAADGFMGPKTRAAISSFQQSRGVSVDGSPSPALLAKLQSTPTNGGTATASSPAWVAPAQAGGAVAPAATPAAATAPGWVAPTKQ